MTASADPLYLVEVDCGHLGTEISGDPQWTKRNVIDLIASGEWQKVNKVLEVREDENRAENITEEVAQALAERFHADREPVPARITEFLHAHLGVMSTRGLNIGRAA